MNALLQALSVLTGFWSTLPALASEEQDISQVKSYTTLYAPYVIRRKTTA